MASRLITQADHGKTVEVQKGDSITIKLPENPTTGYRWSLDEHDPSALEPVETPSFEAASRAIGGGGGRTFTFIAKAPGQSAVGLNLRRVWEDEKLPQKNFRVNIEIRG
jgi:inhibitor of cysteine peptidase